MLCVAAHGSGIISYPARQMPELPEVESARALIAEHGLGREIVARRRRRHLRLPPPRARRDRRRAGRPPPHHAHRQGKSMWIETDGGPVLGLHLGMAGRIVIDDEAAGDYWSDGGRKHLAGLGSLHAALRRRRLAGAARQAPPRPRGPRPAAGPPRPRRRRGHARRLPRARRPRRGPAEGADHGPVGHRRRRQPARRRGALARQARPAPPRGRPRRRGARPPAPRDPRDTRRAIARASSRRGRRPHAATIIPPTRRPSQRRVCPALRSRPLDLEMGDLAPRRPRMPAPRSSRLAQVALARLTPERIASVTPSGEVPASSTICRCRFCLGGRAQSGAGQSGLHGVEALHQRQEDRVRRVARRSSPPLIASAGDDDAAVARQAVDRGLGAVGRRDAHEGRHARERLGQPGALGELGVDRARAQRGDRDAEVRQLGVQRLGEAPGEGLARARRSPGPGSAGCPPRRRRSRIAPPPRARPSSARRRATARRPPRSSAAPCRSRSARRGRRTARPMP